MDSNHQLQLKEFQNIISEMSLDVCCATVLPDLGLRWSEIRRAVHNARLKMRPENVAKILRRFVSEMLQEDELDDLVGQMRIKFVATSGGKLWHAIKLMAPVSNNEAPVAWSKKIVGRTIRAARKTVREPGTTVEVTSTKIDDFVFLSLQPVTSEGRMPPLFAAAAAEEPVAFVTSLSNAPLIHAVVQGLGFKNYVDAELSGKNLTSLLRIINTKYNVPDNQLTQIPPYSPKPVITKTGIDYTTAAYDRKYVENLIGPNPPILTDLELKNERMFFDTSILNKKMAVTLKIKSDNLAITFKNWVEIRAIPPTSEFLMIYHRIQRNKIVCENEEDEEL